MCEKEKVNITRSSRSVEEAITLVYAREVIVEETGKRMIIVKCIGTEVYVLQTSDGKEELISEQLLPFHSTV